MAAARSTPTTRADGPAAFAAAVAKAPVPLPTSSTRSPTRTGIIGTRSRDGRTKCVGTATRRYTSATAGSRYGDVGDLIGFLSGRERRRRFARVRSRKQARRCPSGLRHELIFRGRCRPFYRRGVAEELPFHLAG